MPGQVHAAARSIDAFRAQPGNLPPACWRACWKGDAPASRNDALPRHPAVLWQTGKHLADESGLARKSGASRDGAVRRHPATRNLAHDCDDRSDSTLALGDIGGCARGQPLI